MTRLSITNKENGKHVITGGVDILSLSPVKIMQRVDAELSWLQSQEKPHEIVMDDPTGIVPAMIVAWIMTCAYPCDLRFIGTDESNKLHVGIDEEGHSFVNAWS